MVGSVVSNKSILQYTSNVWSTAELLISAGIKQSDCPKYMMPFFCLLLLESRIVRLVRSLYDDNQQIKPLDEKQKAFIQSAIGFNESIVFHGKTLRSIVQNSGTFEQEFDEYLNGFDAKTRQILGVEVSDGESRLNIQKLIKELRAKGILFSIVRKWSEIDLTSFDNSAVTTLEEHIKQKWADISAETSGEQYTPHDVIQLMSDIVIQAIQPRKGEAITVYDPTCGGGNLLFGIADRLSHAYGVEVQSVGQDWNDQLFALSWIESRFRSNSTIFYGNTLVAGGIKQDALFRVIVANPPHGISWKGYAESIKRDEAKQFVALPPVSDGQLLFVQHVAHHLDSSGIGVVVTNGSALFSGDAGRGESEIRKHFFDNDWVEAIIQLPKDEFYNTGIHTYIWLFNKKKNNALKNRVLLFDAGQMFVPLKKILGKKRREMNAQIRQAITNTIGSFTQGEISQSEEKENIKVVDSSLFYFNKLRIRIWEVDKDGKTIAHFQPQDESNLKPIDSHSFHISGIDSIRVGACEWKNRQVLTEGAYKQLQEKLEAAKNDFAEIKVYTKSESFFYVSDLHTIVKQTTDKHMQMGNGQIVVRPRWSARTHKLSLSAVLLPLFYDDYEFTPYSHHQPTNAQLIQSHLAKNVPSPFKLCESRVGVEINFNTFFHQPESLRSVDDIMADVMQLNQRLRVLEQQLDL